jgi:hypothetical protein
VGKEGNGLSLDGGGCTGKGTAPHSAGREAAEGSGHSGD